MRRMSVSGLCAALMVVVQAGSAYAAGLLGDRGNSPSEDWSTWLPEPLQEALRWIVTQQAWFAAALRDAVAAYRDGDTIAPAMTLVGMSFAYGVFHAVGPGHGKAVVTSYFMARESAIRRGLAMGWLIAGIQALVAILLVGVLGWLLDFSRLALLDSMPLVETASYGLVAVLGAGMVWAALTGRECGHDHGGTGRGHAHRHHRDHIHDHEGGGHGQGAGCQHPHHHHDAHVHVSDAPQGNRLEFVGAALVSGMRPCTGALIVLLFALANGIFLIGALATLAMGVGVALTVSGVGIAAILARRGIIGLSGIGGGRRIGVLALVPRILSVLGSVAVLLIGLLLLAGALQRGF